MISKFDMTLNILKNPNYNEKLNFGQLKNLTREELQKLYDKYKIR